MGCRGISSRSAWRIVPSKGVLGLSFRVGPEEDFTDTKFMQAVINEGNDGVVNSRTNV